MPVNALSRKFLNQLRFIHPHYLRRTHRHSSQLSIDRLAPRSELYCIPDQLDNLQQTLGKFVTYPSKQFSTFIAPFIKPELVEQLSCFEDYSLLVRRVPLQIVDNLIEVRRVQANPDIESHSSNQLNLSNRVVPRFVLYGQPGCGISVSLGQLTHFAALNNWLVFPFTNAECWLERCYDFTPCNDYHQEQHRPELDCDSFDFPTRSAEWLNSFKSVNANFLEKIQPKLSRDVAWTQLEIAPRGTPWLELIDFARNRTKYSTDCIGILLREMRHLCSQPGAPPCLLIIDGVNFLWCRGTRLKDKTLQKKITVDRLAIVHHLRRALHADWLHGAIVTSVNPRAAWPTDREKFTPGYLLGKSGFSHLDPFIPILMENYTISETDAQLRFYAENKWFTNPAAFTKEGRSEMIFLSDRNPLELDRVAAEW